MIVAMAGLPGTGKSTLARRLAIELTGAVIDKDAVRNALFPDRWTEYNTDQDDFVLTLMLRAAEWLVVRQQCPAVIIDGRTFSQSYQLDLVRQTAAKLERELRIIECVCDSTLSLDRIRKDANEHKARNRNEDLYWRMQACFEPIPFPKLIVDTGRPFDLARITDALSHSYVAE